MPSAHEYLQRLLDDPHPELVQWFSERSGGDGPVQHLAFLSLVSQKTPYAFSLALEDANMEERLQLIADTPDPNEQKVLLLADATPAGLAQYAYGTPTVSVNRKIDDAWLICTYGQSGKLRPQRAVGTYGNVPEMKDVQFPKVALLLDTDERDMSGPEWTPIIRCRLDISAERYRARTLAGLHKFSSRLEEREADWQAKRSACNELVKCMTHHRVELDDPGKFLPEISPGFLHYRTQQLFNVGACIALLRYQVRSLLGERLVCTAQDLRAARDLLLAARVVEDRQILPDQAVDLLTILGHLPASQSGWTVNVLTNQIHDMSDEAWEQLESELAPPRRLPRDRVHRTIRRWLKVLTDFGIVRERKQGHKSFFEVDGTKKHLLKPKSIFEYFNLDEPT